MVDVNPNINIPTHYITQYSEQVHIAYQRGGFTLRGLVRTHGQVNGDTVKFPKIGKGEAVEVERGSKIPPSNSDRSWAEAKLKRTYSREDIYDLDKIFTNYDLMAPVQSNSGKALGRKHDDRILSVMNETGNYGKSVNWDLSDPLDTIDEITAYFVDEADIDLNNTPLLMPQKNFNELMRKEQFANAEWVTDKPWEGVQGKVWNNLRIMTRTKLQKTSAGEYIGFAFVDSAVGAYGNSGVTTKVDYDIETDTHICVSAMDQGTCVIDPAGVVRIIYKTS